MRLFPPLLNIYYHKNSEFFILDVGFRKVAQHVKKDTGFLGLPSTYMFFFFGVWIIQYVEEETYV